MTLLAYSEFLNRFVTPTIYMNSSETQARVSELRFKMSSLFFTRSRKASHCPGWRGNHASILTQLKAIEQTETKGFPYRYSIGIFLLLVTFFVAFKKYLNVHQYNEIKLRDKSVFVLVGIVLVSNLALIRLGLLIAGSLSSAFITPPFHMLFAYQIAIPFAAGALLLTILTDRQIAAVYPFALAILTGVMTHGDFYLALYCLSASIGAVLSISKYYQRSSLLKGCSLSGSSAW